MRRNTTVPALTLLAAGVLMVSACAGSANKRADAEAAVDKARLYTVSILPIVDRRVDWSTFVDLEKDLREPAVKTLSRSGYTVVAEESFSPTEDIPVVEVGEMEVSDLAKLGREDVNLLTVIYLEDAVDQSSNGLSYKIEVSALLIDKSAASVVWKDKTVVNGERSGLKNLFGPSELTAGVFHECVKSTFNSFPKGPKDHSSGGIFSN